MDILRPLLPCQETGARGRVWLAAPPKLLLGAAASLLFPSISQSKSTAKSKVNVVGKCPLLRGRIAKVGRGLIIVSKEYDLL